MGFLLVICSFLIFAYTRHPYNHQPIEVMELPPIRDVSMPPPHIWIYDDNTLMDPVTRKDPPWMRVGAFAEGGCCTTAT